MNTIYKSIVFSTAIITIGIGIMANFRRSEIIRTLGGGIFIVGLIVMALSIHGLLKNGSKK